MAQLEPTKMTLSAINDGKRYTNADGLQAETINAVVESGAWVQALATTQPNTSNANQVGTPSVTIDQSGDTPQFVFANLKGATGAKGERGDTGAQGPQGIQGKQGPNGITPQMRMNGDTLQVSYDNGSIWNNIYTFPFYNGD